MTSHLPLLGQRFSWSDESREREIFHSHTRALCPACRRTVDGARLIRGGKVYLRRHCPEHGAHEALISGDADWFLRSLTYVKPGSVPLAYATEVGKGCPDDCGLCPDHEQHTCLPIIEITNHCNLECPICLVDNRHNHHMSLQDFERILDGLVEKEGAIETINLSGGEPTLHPRLLELLDAAVARDEIARVSISSNGLRLAAEPGLCEELARRGVYVSLQLDGLDPGALGALRGAGNQLAAKHKALDNLERAGVRTTLVSTVARGVNDHLVGDVVRLFYDKSFLLSLMFQPAVYNGAGGGRFQPHDPLDVVTISDVVAAIDAQSDGLLTKEDFLPLPCSHPSCFGLTYLLEVDGAFVPFGRFLGMERYLDLLANQGTIRPDAEFELAIRDTIDELWTGSAQIPDGDKILRSLRRAIMLMYPEERALELSERLRLGEGMVKTIFIHGFMDAHTFEIERIRRCCTHYALPDGRLMPGCAYNVVHRPQDARFAGPVGEPQPWPEGEP